MELRGGGDFFTFGANKHSFLICLGAPSLIPRTAHYISLIWDLQGPKLAQIFQKWPKSYFEHSGGRLEWRGTKLERVTGRPGWEFSPSWECGGAPNFGQERP